MTTSVPHPQVIDKAVDVERRIPGKMFFLGIKGHPSRKVEFVIFKKSPHSNLKHIFASEALFLAGPDILDETTKVVSKMLVDIKQITSPMLLKRFISLIFEEEREVLEKFITFPSETEIVELTPAPVTKEVEEKPETVPIEEEREVQVEKPQIEHKIDATTFFEILSELEKQIRNLKAWAETYLREG